MAYSDLTIEMLQSKYGIANNVGNLFENITKIYPTQWLMDSLENAKKLPLRSEKAKSEAIVFPILMELKKSNNDYFTIFSGENLNVDELNLRGECDFIIAKETNSYTLGNPIMQIVEAKKNDIDVGIPQCAAQMVGAKFFNKMRNPEIEVVYGCVTTADEWVFLRLEDNLIIDKKKYYLNEIEYLLGAFQSIIDFYKNI